MFCRIFHQLNELFIFSCPQFICLVVGTISFILTSQRRRSEGVPSLEVYLRRDSTPENKTWKAVKVNKDGDRLNKLR